MDASGFQTLFKRHRRQDRRDAFGEHRFARSGRTDKKHVMYHLTTHTSVRYVRQVSKADEPEAIDCYFCGGLMKKGHRIETERLVKVIWRCSKCAAQYWKSYGDD